MTFLGYCEGKSVVTRNANKLGQLIPDKKPLSLPTTTQVSWQLSEQTFILMNQFGLRCSHLSLLILEIK